MTSEGSEEDEEDLPSKRYEDASECGGSGNREDPAPPGTVEMEVEAGGGGGSSMEPCRAACC